MMAEDGWITFSVNGMSYELRPHVTRTLARVLREELGLTGTKVMCNEGECGACTVLVNGVPKLSCMMLAVDSQDKEILTIEGLADQATGDLHPIQQALRVREARPIFALTQNIYRPACIRSMRRSGMRPLRRCTTIWTNSLLWK